jgi:hypothetical protein
VKTEVLSVGREQKLKKEVMPNQNTTESGQLRGGVCIAWMGTPR